MHLNVNLSLFKTIILSIFRFIYFNCDPREFRASKDQLEGKFENAVNTIHECDENMWG